MSVEEDDTDTTAADKIQALVGDLIPRQSARDEPASQYPQVCAQRYPVKLTCEIAWQLYFRWRTTGEVPCSHANGDYVVGFGEVQKALVEREQQEAKPEARRRLIEQAEQDRKTFCTSDNTMVALGRVGRRPMSKRGCSPCGGTGSQICWRCSGVGRVRVLQRDANGKQHTVSRMCHAGCGGWGRVSCLSCLGCGALCDVGELYADVQVSAVTRWGCNEPPDWLAQVLAALTGHDFVELAPGAVLESAELDQGGGLIYGLDLEVVAGQACAPGSQRWHRFAFVADQGTWLEMPRGLVEQYALGLRVEVEGLRLGDAARVNELVSRWPLIEVIARRQVQSRKEAREVVASHCEGALSDDTVRAVADPVVEAQRRLAPRTTALYWCAIAVLFVVLGVFTAPVFADPARMQSIGIASALALAALAYGGGVALTVWRRRHAPQAMKAPRTDGLYALLAAGLLAAASYAGVQQPPSSSWIDTIEQRLEGEVVAPADGRSLSQVQIQHVLKRLGHYGGPIDGIVGPGTRAAVEAFERARGLNVDGSVSPGDAQALVEAWRISEIERALRARGKNIAVDGVADAHLRARLRNTNEVAGRGEIRFDAALVRAFGGAAQPPN